MDDMLDEGWMDDFDWANMNDEDLDMMMQQMTEIDDYDYQMPEYDPDNEYLYGDDDLWAVDEHLFEEMLWNEPY